MDQKDWYRLVTWTNADEKEFMARLNRARSEFNKAQYLRIQALYLQREATPPLYDESIKLLDILLEEYPQSPEAAGALMQKAQCFEANGRLEEATEIYIMSIEMDQKTSGIKTRAPPEFAQFVVKYKLKPHYKMVVKALSESKMLLLFPEGQFIANTALAIIANEQGRKRKARVFAEKAINASDVKDSGLQGKSDIGLVKNPDKDLLARLQSIVDS